MSASLVLYAETRPILVASRLRVAFERQGFAALPPKSDVPPDGFSLVLRKDGPAACWIHPDHPEAIPDELGRLLSHELRCPVTSIATMDDVCAYERAEGGEVVEKMATRGDEVLEDSGGRYHLRVQSGESLATLLADDGLDGHRVSHAEAATIRRAMVIGFAPLPGRTRRTIEIDPGLSCPECGQAMRTMEGKFGAFFGCVRFPSCRGRFTEKQAEAQREATRER